MRKFSSESGQAATEYILMMAVIVFLFLAIKPSIQRLQLNTKLMQPLQTEFASAYQFGHPSVQGPDSGNPNNHPRFTTGNNFRIFILK